MLGSLGTKLALKKLGLPSDPLKDFNPFAPSASDLESSHRELNKLRKPPPDPDADDSWATWMSVKSLPLSVQPWLSPSPPPNKIARMPNIGDEAPQDPKGDRLRLQRGRRTLLVFLRCVGCAFAQKTFINLRTLANRYNGALHCIAVSHASPEATRRWIDLLGGAWSVEVVVDENRSLYAAWGLGTGNTWYVLNPATQIQAFKEKGWLGDKVAGSIKEKEDRRAHVSPRQGVQRTGTGGSQRMGTMEENEGEDQGPLTTMGNKWQEAGSFAVDARGKVIWGGKALKADDVMDLDEGAKLLMM